MHLSTTPAATTAEGATTTAPATAATEPAADGAIAEQVWTSVVAA